MLVNVIENINSSQDEESSSIEYTMDGRLLVRIQTLILDSFTITENLDLIQPVVWFNRFFYTALYVDSV